MDLQLQVVDGAAGPKIRGGDKQRAKEGDDPRLAVVIKGGNLSQNAL